MGKSTPSPPPAPDPYQTASAQGTSNANTATAQTALNNANTYTPYGQTTYTVTGSQTITNPDGTTTSVPTYSVRQDLSGTQQNILNQDQGMEERTNSIASAALGNIGTTLTHPVTASQINPVQTSIGATPTLATGYDQGGAIQGSVPVQQVATTFAGSDPSSFSAERDAATNAALARLQPSMDQQDAQLQAQLANQGVSLGSSAYGAAELDQAQQNNDLRLGAVGTGDAEQQALYQEALGSANYGMQAAQQNNAAALAAGTFANSAQAQQNTENQAQAAFGNTAATQDWQNRLAGGQFGNAASAQQLSQDMALQNQQINEIDALRSGNQVQLPASQGYSAATLDQTPISSDVYATAGLENQQYMAQLQNSAQNTAAMGSALGGIMGGVGRKSDVRLKTDIVPFARARNGLTIYAYRMPGEEPGWHLGFMAHEVALLHPDAVWTDPGDGWARVDYERAVA